MESMFAPLYKVIGYLLALYYSFFPSPTYGLGIAIILLTATVMLVMFPLTAKQTRSMIAMQRVQPEIKRIQQKYKDDKPKQQEELLKFYQENKINPLAGCLPLIVQSPVFIALLGTLRETKGTVKHVPHSAGRMGELYRDLCRGSEGCKDPHGLRFLSMDLSKASAHLTDVVDNVVQRFPYYGIVVIVVVLGWYQTRQTMVRQQRSGTMQNNPMNSQMQALSKVMPVLFGVFTYFAPAGVGLYFVTSSLWRIGQQHLVLNKYYDHPNEFAGANKDGETDAGSGKDRSAASADGATDEKPRTQPSQHAAARKKKKKRKR